MKVVLRINLSQSAMAVYRDCPHAYYLRYKFRYEPMFWSRDPLDVGSYVHNSIDRYYKHHFLTEGDYNDVLLRTYQILKSEWDVTLTAADLKKAYTSLQNHAEWEAANIKSGINTKPLTEVKIAYDGFYGIIDYVDLAHNRLIDWKTNKWPTLSYTYRMQAEMYRILFEGKFDEKLTHFYFFFLYPNEWRTVRYDYKKQKGMKEKIYEMRDEIYEAWDNEEFPKNPRTKSGCNSCLYRFYCKREERTKKESIEHWITTQ